MCGAIVYALIFPIEGIILAGGAVGQVITAVLAAPIGNTIAKPTSACSMRRATHRALIELKWASSGDL
jgi:hypothetical protein